MVYHAAPSTSHCGFSILSSASSHPASRAPHLTSFLAPSHPGVQPLLCTGPRHAYSEWVDTYSSPAYLELPLVKEGLLQELCALAQPSHQAGEQQGGGAAGAEQGCSRPNEAHGEVLQAAAGWLRRLQPLYSRAMELELQFFLAALPAGQGTAGSRAV